MRYFLIAGEASGDLHASELIRAIKSYDPEASFRFLGGDKMAEAAGVQPVVHYKKMAYMGFVDVLLHLRSVLGNLDAAKKSLKDFAPDALVLIDYPSFNLRVAKYAVTLGIPVYYYISPKVWAWKEHRVKEIKKLVKRMFCILPFEVDFYKTRHDYDVTYVGNPSLNEVDRKLAEIVSKEDFYKSNALSPKPLIALVPGSRISEIKTNLPYMLGAAKNFESDYQPVIAAAPGVDEEIYDRLAPGVTRLSGQTFELMRYASAALVTSGTATLEAALLGTPQVVAYRAVGSKLVYNFFKKILKVQFVSLPNLICGREIVKELLLHLCTVDSLSAALADILPCGSHHSALLADYAHLRTLLGTNNAPQTAAQIITRQLHK